MAAIRRNGQPDTSVVFSISMGLVLKEMLSSIDYFAFS
jgi:hypothetical protein